MRLAEFIVANREPILAEWEAFARTCTPASGVMDITALRDHANEMLTVIAADLDTPQGVREQSEKSKGNAPSLDANAATAAEEHGSGRAQSGFSVDQMVAEYRALRASVIRLWTKTQGKLAAADIEDLTRFNEAIDQSLAESVSRYTEDLDHSKEIFLAILGHDLRTPLGAIQTSASFLMETQVLQEPALTLIPRIARSATRTVNMVGDLLDFTRSRIGSGIPIVRAEADMGKMVHDVVDEIAVARPGREFDVATCGEQRGEWDCERISQALSNLIGNAVQHGSEETKVSVKVEGVGQEVAVSIHNHGTPIGKDQLNGIFNPLKSRDAVVNPTVGGAQGSLGLGLYIAERIVHAHRGTIEIESSEAQGTTFTVRLPRHEDPQKRATGPNS
jgi:signal transduction histidine kinase